MGSDRARALWRRHRDLLIVVGAGLALRLIYNLFVHPPLDYVDSDMGGYLRRAQRLLDEPAAQKDPWAAFFPHGTHYLVAAVLGAFGRSARAPLGIVLAVTGAGAVGYAFSIGARVLASHPRRLLAIFGALVIANPAHVMIGGNILSEGPFSLALAAFAFHALRLHEGGRLLDAMGTGVAAAIGATIRPQMLLSVVLIAIVSYLGRRERRAALRTLHGVVVLAPIVLIVALSAARVHKHTGRWSLVSTNGAFNLAVGRCHAGTLTAARTPEATFRSAPLRRLEALHEEHPVLALGGTDPALGKEVRFDAELWDESAARALAGRCVATTGILRQVRYSAMHVVLLWVYNLPFPTRGPLAVAGAILSLAMVPGAAVGVWWSLRKRDILLLFVSVHVVALVATAVIFFGEARMRVPYDAFFMILALHVYATWWARRRARRGSLSTAAAGPATTSRTRHALLRPRSEPVAEGDAGKQGPA